MKAPLVITHDRFRLICSEDSIRIDLDGGNGLLMILTDAEKIELEAALRNSRRRAKLQCGNG